VDDSQRLDRALAKIAQEDPTLRITTRSEDEMTVVSGVGEVHLEIAIDRVSREYGIPIAVGNPEIIYLETIRHSSEGEGKYVRAISSRTFYGHVKLRLKPLEAGSGYQFACECSDETIPREFVEPVNLGVQEGMKGGVVAGYELVDLRAVLVGGSHHVNESSEMAFRIAGSMAFKEAARKASPVVLEPVMAIEVVFSEDHAGIILGDLSQRRGLIEGMEHREVSMVVRAQVPFAEMIGYAAHLRLVTQGRAECSMHFAKYEAVSGGGHPGTELADVTAKRPNHPYSGRGSAAAKLDDEHG
jgi:elongation factor G